jgi:hypothetical protein
LMCWLLPEGCNESQKAAKPNAPGAAAQDGFKRS